MEQWGLGPEETATIRGTLGRIELVVIPRTANLSVTFYQIPEVSLWLNASDNLQRIQKV